ncbi:MAG: tetratricopeptide repeat protein [Verrucomicrobia bacterium]|nr:MAG: tetratricopeptide repeat protein [Verrucomicrobiota bacterium]
MTRRFFSIVFATLLGGLCLVGCRSGQGTSPSGAKPSVISTNAALPKVASSSDRAAKQRAAAHAHYGTAIAYELDGKSDLALDEFYQAVQADPDNEELALEVSTRLLDAKKPEKALELLQRTAKRPEVSGETLTRLGLIYAQQNRLDDAIAANRAAISKLPDSLLAYQGLYFNYLQTKKPDDALKTLDLAARQNSVDDDFLVGLAELYANFASQFPTRREVVHRKSLGVLRRVDRSHTMSPRQKLRLADDFFVAGDTKAAAQIYEGLLPDFSDLATVRDQLRGRLADIFLRDSDRTNAVKQLEAIVQEQPANAQAYYLLGSLASESGTWTNAIDYFKKAILLRPAFQQAYYDLAAAQIAARKPDDALATLSDSRVRFRQTFTVEFLDAMANVERKDFNHAVEKFNTAEVIAKATETNRLNEQFYFQFGAACERKGDLPQAERCFQEALRIAPDFAEALNYLGYTWADRGEKLEQAYDYIRRALKMQADNGAYLDSMAWVLFKQGRLNDALEYILKAVAKNEEPDATLYDHLGDIYAALKQLPEARKAWKKSIELEPNDAVKKKLDAAAE